MVEKMRIGELAKRAGVTTRTIRYYEELGLLGVPQSSHERAEGDFRYYSETNIARLQKIATLKQLGLSLEQISSVLDLFFDQQKTSLAKQKILDMLQSHLQETEEKIMVLQQFRTELLQNIALIQQVIAEQAQAR